MSSANRNTSNPQAGDEQPPAVSRHVGIAPMLTLIAVGVLLYAGGMYLDRHAGGFRANVYEPYRSLEYVESLQPQDKGDKLMAQGKQVYQTCSACHQASGEGMPGQFPPLKGSKWVLASGPDRIIRIVLNGLTGPIEVAGETWQGVPMPAIGSGFSNQEIAAVLTYIRQNEEWGHNASAVTPEEVAAVREKVSDRSAPWTAKELKKIPVGEEE